MKTIGIFIYDGFQLLDASGPITAIEFAEKIVPNSYQLKILSSKGDLVRSSCGIAIDSVAIAELNLPDTLIVSGGLIGPAVLNCATSMSYLRKCSAEIRRVCSVCSGAGILAAAGLLDGRKATTHWQVAEEFQNTYPKVQVEIDRIYVRDGNICTSAGVSAGIDMTLALIAEDLGEDIARQVAKEMVVYYKRPGGQSQFSVLADLGSDENEFSSLLNWMRSNLLEKLTVEELADRMAMSPRNFSRAFVRVIGISPAKAVVRLRLEAARERIENSRDPIEQIAIKTGFNDPERMRRSFIKAFGQPPQALRRKYI